MSELKVMKTKVIFEITYNPSRVNQIGELMSKMDLGIDGILWPKHERISFTTTTKVTDKYLTVIKDKLREAYETTGNTIFSLKFVSKESLCK